MNNKLIGKMYAILLDLEEEFKNQNVEKHFWAYSKDRINILHNNAMDWLAEDEREKKEKTALIN